LNVSRTITDNTKNSRLKRMGWMRKSRST